MSAAVATEVLHIGNLEVRPTEYQVLADDVRVNLTTSTPTSGSATGSRPSAARSDAR
jgi:hypothetical protein